MLLKNIPAVTGLSRKDALRGSIYYLQSPLLEEWEREKLSSSVFACGSTNTNGLRTFNARGAPTVLKYCVACARRDADLKKPAIWRVVPNHPGSIACSEHGIRLQISDAPASGNRLCDPAQWIKLDVPLPPVATEAELAIARDFDWIYAQRGRVTPGFRPIALKLRDALLNRADLTFSDSGLDTTKLLQAARDKLSEPARLIFGPQLGPHARGFTLPTGLRTTLHVYCLCAHLAGTSLQQILIELANVPCASVPPKGSPGRRFRRIRFHKKRIDDFLAAHPFSTRAQIISALVHSVDVVRSGDLAWYEQRMPKSRAHKTGRKRPYSSWEERDSQLCAMASRYIATPGASPFRAIQDALTNLDLSRNLMWRERGRLPKFRALLQSLIAPKQAAA